MRPWWLLLLLAPAAGAQWTYDVDLEASGPERVTVDDAVVYEIQWEVTCEVAPSAAAAPTSTWAAKLSFDPAEGILISGMLAHPFEGPDCTTTTSTTGSAQWQVGATPAAPGLTLTELPIGIDLSWGGGPTPAGSVTGAGMLQVTPDYYGRIEAKAPIKLWQAEPGERTQVEVEITNFGNTATTIDIEATGRGVDVPASWPAGGLAPQETRTLLVNYTHPDGAGWNNDQQALGLKLTPRSAVDQEKTGEPVTLNLLGRTRGMPGAAAPLVLLGIALFAARRR